METKSPCSHSFQPAFSLGSLSLGYPVAAGRRPWVAELAFQFCADCLFVKTIHPLPSDDLSDENFYSSKVAKVVGEHDAAFAEMSVARLGLTSDSTVLEIGSGDGNLLSAFIAKGMKGIGVDPAPHASEQYPFELVHGFYTQAVADGFKAAGIAPKLVIANYVLELIPDIEGFLAAVGTILTPDSRFVFEVPYLLDFMRTPRLDGFAHLRCNWFTAHSIYALCEGQGLGVEAIEHIPDYRGGTLRAWIRNSASNPPGETEKRLLASETNTLTPEGFEAFQNRNRALREDLRTQLLRGTYGALVGYGGGLKAATLVNWLGITEKDIAFSVDADPNKQGKVIPLANIPIRPLSELATLSAKEPVSVVLLAFDHQTEIVEDLKKLLPENARIIRMLPQFNVDALHEARS